MIHGRADRQSVTPVTDACSADIHPHNAQTWTAQTLPSVRRSQRLVSGMPAARTPPVGRSQPDPDGWPAPPRPAVRRAALHAAGLACLVGAVCLPSGCETPDTRMSWEQVQELELELRPADDDPQTVQVADAAAPEPHHLTVQPGDVLQLTLLERNDKDAQSTLQTRVHSDGTIALPLPGPIEVAGLDLEGVERAVIDAHVPRYLRRLAVFAELRDSEPVTVILTGPGGQPALVELPRNARTVIHALAQTRGLEALGTSLVTVTSNNPDHPNINYDLSSPADIRRALAAAPLQNGDILSVSPATSSVIYAVGLLNNPGPIPVPSGGRLSLVQTVASAGGLADFLNPQEATLWRRMPDGRTVRARIELASIMAGESPDIELRAGDVLDIPHTAETRFRQWLSEAIVIGPFGMTAVYDPMADRRALLLQDDNKAVYRAIVLDSLLSGVTGGLVQPTP